MVTEGGQGAGIYDEQLEYLCVHAYTARHSEPDTHCIRFEITHVRSTWLIQLNYASINGSILPLWYTLPRTNCGERLERNIF